MPNPHTASQSGLEQPNARGRYEVSRDQLPIHCPMPGTSLWNSHPQVFIALNDEGFGKCPYCGAEYQVKD